MIVSPRFFLSLSPSSFFVPSRKELVSVPKRRFDSRCVLDSRVRDQPPKRFGSKRVSISLSSALRFSAFSPRLPARTARFLVARWRTMEDVIDTREPARDPLVVEEDAWRKFEPPLSPLSTSIRLPLCVRALCKLRCSLQFSRRGGRGEALETLGKSRCKSDIGLL